MKKKIRFKRWLHLILKFKIWKKNCNLHIQCIFKYWKEASSDSFKDILITYRYGTWPIMKFEMVNSDNWNRKAPLASPLYKLLKALVTLKQTFLVFFYGNNIIILLFRIAAAFLDFRGNALHPHPHGLFILIAMLLGNFILLHMVYPNCST